THRTPPSPRRRFCSPTTASSSLLLPDRRVAVAAPNRRVAAAAPYRRVSTAASHRRVAAGAPHRREFRKVEFQFVFLQTLENTGWLFPD
ncbi:hypothetical protein SOVF_139690, partial [Spinacia oleracea]